MAIQINTSISALSTQKYSSSNTLEKLKELTSKMSTSGKAGNSGQAATVSASEGLTADGRIKAGYGVSIQSVNGVDTVSIHKVNADSKLMQRLNALKTQDAGSTQSTQSTQETQAAQKQQARINDDEAEILAYNMKNLLVQNPATAMMAQAATTGNQAVWSLIG